MIFMPFFLLFRVLFIFSWYHLELSLPGQFLTIPEKSACRTIIR